MQSQNQSQNQGNKEYLLAVLAVTVIGTLIDGFTTGWGLLALLKANNPFATVLALGSGILITALAVATVPIWKNSSTPGIVKVLWLVAIVVDTYTTALATLNYAIMNNNSDQLLYLSQVFYEPKNITPTIVAIGGVMIINGSSLAVMPILKQIQTP